MSQEQVQVTARTRKVARLGAALAALAFGVLGARGESHAADLSARDIMLKSENATQVRDITSDATLTTGGDSAEKVKLFTWWRKLGDKAHYRTLTRFNEPAEIRGEGILIAEGDGANDVQVYLPSYQKTRRVAGQSQSTGFMGTVFSYSDIAQFHTDDYTHVLVRQEACPGEAKVQCYVVESTSANDAVRDRTGYAKLLQWVRADNFVIAQVETTALDGKPWKKLVSSQVREVDAKEHKWLAHAVRVDDLRSKKYSTLQFSNVKVNTQLADDLFTKRNLERQ